MLPRSQTERLWMIGGGLAAFLMILIGYVLVISSQSDETDSVDTKVAAANAQNDALQARVNALAVQNTNLAKYQAAAASALQALPNSSGMPDFLRTLQSVGSQTGTSLTSLTVGTPVDVTATANGATAGATPAPAAAPTNGTPVAGTVYALPISAQVSGSVASLNAFLTQLQAVQPRAVLISQIAEQPNDATGSAGSGAKAGGSMSISLTMNAFVAPASPAESSQLQHASSGN